MIKDFIQKKEISIKNNLPTLTATAMSVGNAVLMSTAYASDAGATMVSGIIDMAGFIALVLGVIYGIFGFIHYSAANSDGDGPAKKKAQNEIASAVMLALAGVILSFVDWAAIITSAGK